VELNVRFVKPARPGGEAIVSGELVENRRNKIFEARAELRDGAGKLLASATGKYLPMKNVEAIEMAGDFVGDSSRIFGP
jgi:acyl-coenzyme A thioesterase PaaI-like protein